MSARAVPEKNNDMPRQKKHTADDSLVDRYYRIYYALVFGFFFFELMHTSCFSNFIGPIVSELLYHFPRRVTATVFFYNLEQRRGQSNVAIRAQLALSEKNYRGSIFCLFSFPTDAPRISYENQIFSLGLME